MRKWKYTDKRKLNFSTITLSDVIRRMRYFAHFRLYETDVLLDNEETYVELLLLYRDSHTHHRYKESGITNKFIKKIINHFQNFV